MDYIIMSALQRFQPLLQLGLSYDIMCQWRQKFLTRIKSLPPNLWFDFARFTLDQLIPKFHLRAHKLQCQSNFSFNYQPGVGRTDGEGVERDWAGMNAAASSTKEMSEGNRHDALDDFWGDWNYRKGLGLGKHGGFGRVSAFD